MLTGRTKAYSSSCPQAVTHRSTNRARRRVTLFQPKHVTNYATPPTPVGLPCRHLVNDFVSQPQIPEKSVKKSLVWHSKSSKVIEFGANWKAVYDFLLVINSNLGLISHRYEIQRVIGRKSQILTTPSHLGPSFGVTPFEFMEKLYGSWNLESSGQPTVKIWWS